MSKNRSLSRMAYRRKTRPKNLPKASPYFNHLLENIRLPSGDEKNLLTSHKRKNNLRHKFGRMSTDSLASIPSHPFKKKLPVKMSKSLKTTLYTVERTKDKNEMEIYKQESQNRRLHLTYRIKKSKRIKLLQEVELNKKRENWLKAKKVEKLMRINKNNYNQRKKREAREFAEEKKMRKQHLHLARKMTMEDNAAKAKSIKESLMLGRHRSLNQLREQKLLNFKQRKRERIQNYTNIFYDEEKFSLDKLNQKLEGELKLSISSFNQRKEKFLENQAKKKKIQKQIQMEDELIEDAQNEIAQITQAQDLIKKKISYLNYHIERPVINPEDDLVTLNNYLLNDCRESDRWENIVEGSTTHDLKMAEADATDRAEKSKSHGYEIDHPAADDYFPVKRKAHLSTKKTDESLEDNRFGETKEMLDSDLYVTHMPQRAKHDDSNFIKSDESIESDHFDMDGVIAYGLR